MFQCKRKRKHVLNLEMKVVDFKKAHVALEIKGIIREYFRLILKTGMFG